MPTPGSFQPSLAPAASGCEGAAHLISTIPECKIKHPSLLPLKYLTGGQQTWFLKSKSVPSEANCQKPDILCTTFLSLNGDGIYPSVGIMNGDTCSNSLFWGQFGLIIWLHAWQIWLWRQWQYWSGPSCYITMKITALQLIEIIASDCCEWLSHISYIGLSENKLFMQLQSPAFRIGGSRSAHKVFGESFYPSSRSVFYRQGLPAWKQSDQLMAILCREGITSPANGLGLHSIPLAFTACPHLGNHRGWDVHHLDRPDLWPLPISKTKSVSPTLREEERWSKRKLGKCFQKQGSRCWVGKNDRCPLQGITKPCSGLFRALATPVALQ